MPPGPATGLPFCVAKRLVRDGFAVVVNFAGNAAEADATVTEIKSDGGQVIAVRADVGNAAEVERLFGETVKAFGSIEVVVNNSGIMPLSPIGKGDAALFDKVIQTNLRGTFLVMAQAAQHMAGGGWVIAFSSSVLGPYKGYGKKIQEAFAAIVPDDADVSAVAAAIVNVVDAPFAKRSSRSGIFRSRGDLKEGKFPYGNISLSLGA